MNGFKLVMLSAVAGCCMLAVAPKAMAQVQGQAAAGPAQISLEVGIAPDCPYGYYDTTPYSCAPYGYYGTEWFNGGIFVGAGPWFKGSDDFRGHVDNRLHVDNGYKGKLPERGEKAEASNHLDKNDNFKGNEMRDGRGHKDAGPKNDDKK
jgi:hypothetical protein